MAASGSAAADGKQSLEGANQAVGTFAHSIAGFGAHGDVSVDAGAAAHPERRWAVSQIHLFNIAARRQIGLTFNDFHHTGAALTDATAVVEVVQTVVGVDTSIKGSLAEVGTFNAAHLLAFLFESDGGHGSVTISGAHQLTSNCGQNDSTLTVLHLPASQLRRNDREAVQPRRYPSNHQC